MKGREGSAAARDTAGAAHGPCAPGGAGRAARALRVELTIALAALDLLLLGDAAAPAEGRAPPPARAPSRDLLERARAAGERLAVMLEELAAAAWLEPGGGGGMEPTPVDPGALLHAAWQNVERSGRGAAATCSVETRGAGIVRADRDLLAFSFEQLLSFAAARSSGRELRVTASAEPSAWLVEVEDQGGVLGDETLARLFDPFEELTALPRGDPASRRARLGLGLAIARAIVRAHGGEASARRADTGGGVVVACRMPLIPRA